METVKKKNTGGASRRGRVSPKSTHSNRIFHSRGLDSLRIIKYSSIMTNQGGDESCRRIALSAERG
jgi:hypothetical protein